MPEPMRPQPMTPTFLIATSSTLSHAEHFSRRTSFAGGYRGAPRRSRGAPNMWGFGGHFEATQPTFQRTGTATPGRPEHFGGWGPFQGPQYYRRRPGRGGGSKNSPPGDSRAG